MQLLEPVDDDLDRAGHEPEEHLRNFSGPSPGGEEEEARQEGGVGPGEAFVHAAKVEDDKESEGAGSGSEHHNYAAGRLMHVGDEIAGSGPSGGCQDGDGHSRGVSSLGRDDGMGTNGGGKES